jgi:hypothetical protein
MEYWARIINGKVVEMIRRPKPGQKITFDRLVNVSGRPDIGVGSTWPFCTVEEAIAGGKLELAPTESDPGALRVPTPKGAS